QCVTDPADAMRTSLLSLKRPGTSVRPRAGACKPPRRSGACPASDAESRAGGLRNRPSLSTLHDRESADRRESPQDILFPGLRRARSCPCDGSGRRSAIVSLVPSGEPDGVTGGEGRAPTAPLRLSTAQLLARACGRPPH